MKALILAGGFGTRLRPLSCTRPKMMFPVANKLLLDWTLENLANVGVNEVVLAVNYMAEAIKKRFGKTRYGMEITYSREFKPLGTGGPVKKAEKSLSESGDPFFVLNGDVLSTVQYADLYKIHQSSGAKATIALHEAEDPSRYGVVDLNENNQILRFVEKPSSETAPSRLVNAGVYVLSSSILDYIPPRKKVSIEREVFPLLASEGSLYGYQFNGLWVDIGEPAGYIQANRLVLDRIAKNEPLIENAKVHPKAELFPPVAIGNESTIREEACIGPYTVICENVNVGKGVRIQDSVVLQGAWIEDFSSLKRVIVGEGAIIGRWVKIEENCIIGDHAIINDNVTLTRGVQVCHDKEVSSSILEPGSIM